jgi:hypothetical protein
MAAWGKLLSLNKISSKSRVLSAERVVHNQYRLGFNWKRPG